MFDDTPPGGRPPETPGGLLRQWHPAYYAAFFPARGPTARPAPPLPPAV